MEEKDLIYKDGFKHIAYFMDSCTQDEMIVKSASFYEWMHKRRSVREFSDKPVSKKVIENIIKTASTSPSGANKQPWVFCAVSNPKIKRDLRIAAEKEEKESYESRMSERWKNDLKSIGTDANKAFLEISPWLIIVCKKAYDIDENKEKRNNYYVNESVGIACGMLITAIHNAGLATLTHTPSPMKFLTDILQRPENERPFLLLPVGYPRKPAFIPDLKRKKLEEIAVFYE